MEENIESFVESVMETAQQSDRNGIFPLLRSQWSRLDTKDDAYFSIKENYDFIYLQLSLTENYKKEVGELKFLNEIGTMNLSGNEKENSFLVITYPSESRRYYIPFVVECCSTLTPKHNIGDMEKILFKWIKRWKLKGRSSREKRIGVFGEILCLEYLLTKIANVEWKCWQERISDSGLHDFIVNSKLLEVKTTTVENALIHVFDSDQFEHSENLRLIFVRLLKDTDSGRSLNKIISDVRLLIPEDDLDFFDSIIISLGHPFPELKNEIFVVDELKIWVSSPDGSFLQQSDLIVNNRCGHGINYSIYESEIEFVESGDISVIGKYLD